MGHVELYSGEHKIAQLSQLIIRFDDFLKFDFDLFYQVVYLQAVCYGNKKCFRK